MNECKYDSLLGKIETINDLVMTNTIRWAWNDDLIMIIYLMIVKTMKLNMKRVKV